MERDQDPTAPDHPQDSDEHLASDPWPRDPALLPGRVHRHLIRICSRCEEAWRSLSWILRQAYEGILHLAAPEPALRLPREDDLPTGEAALAALRRTKKELQKELRRLARSTAPPSSPPGWPPCAISTAHRRPAGGFPGPDRGCKDLIRKIRKATRKARLDLGWLLSLPMEDWPRRVSNARTRMRSRAFAELLIEEARERVKTAPKEAAVLAGLVKPALDRRPGRLELRWARALVARGQAHRANALRVVGDLRAADAAFAGLRAELDEQALEDPVLLAELASLEASLRKDQRRMDEAEALLQEASRSFRSASDGDGHARVLIKQVNLAHSVGEPRRVLRHLDEFETLNAKPALKYRASTVAARVAALCDLGRPDDAREHLSLNRSALEAEGNPHSLAALHWLEGRIQLGMGNFLAASSG